MEVNGEDYSSLVGFLSEGILEALFGDKWGETSTASVASCPVGVANSHPLSPSSSACKHAHSDVEIRRLLKKNLNANTAKSTRNWVRKFSKWATEHKVNPEISEIPEDEHDGVLQRFYAEIRRNDGDNYEPESLKVMQASLDRHLRDKGCPYSIMKDMKFSTSRKVLSGKAIDLQEQGMGKRKRKADALTHEEEERIWSSGVLDGDNPSTLNCLTFYLLSQHMGTRGRQEHHQIRVEDLKIVRDCHGEITHIEWVEGPTKTCQGGLKERPRSVSQKIFKIGGVRCPVGAIIKLLSKRPLDMRASGQLYLSPLKKERDWSITEVWFQINALSVNTIGRLMETIATKAGLDVTSKRFTNHSLRKTTVTKLCKSGATNREIMAITGHKSEQGLADYDALDLDDHCHLGKLIGGAQDTVMEQRQSKPPSKEHSVSAPVPQSLLTHPFSSCSPHSIIFHNCSFSNCFSSCSSSSYSQQSCSSGTSKKSLLYRKRAYIQSSDSDSD